LWGGAALATAGLIDVGVTYAQAQDQSLTPRAFRPIQIWNTVGWTAAGVGAGSFVLSFFLRPARHAPAVSSLVLRPDGIGWRGSF
jgi:hypothetical protein